MTQPGLFDNQPPRKIADPPPSRVESARVNNPEHEDLRSGTSKWISENPDVYQMFVQFAIALVSVGKPFGVKFLAERVRWECVVQKRGEYKLNNNYVAYIARRLCFDVPGLAKLICIRQTQW